MIEIIPSINAPTFQEVTERITKVEPYVSWCHLDVTDGVFSAHSTWNNPTDLSALHTKLNVEVHLMVQKPETIIDQWLVRPIMRVIVHLEASEDIGGIIEKCKKAGIECGVAIRPDTPIDALIPWIYKADILQILAVNPGPSGQEMSSDIADKISHLHNVCQECIIEVDGGINPDTVALAREAGAKLFVSGGYIFSKSDINTAIKELKDSS
ncbi:MAG: hypothetical protein AAB972_03075 [Patescibacteria group bacterium]